MNEVAEQQIEQELDYKSMYEKAQADLQAVAKKKDELLAETKSAKKAREEALSMAQKAELDKAAKDGEFEKLWQSSEQKAQELEKRISEMKNANRQEKIQTHALRIASELADGDNIELLSDFIARNLDKVAEEDGALSADITKAIKDEFANNSKFKSLLRSSKASGGGAVGNTSATVQSKTVTREVFETWTAGKKMEHIKSGGTLV